MTPYAGFVWSAYGISALVLGALSASIWVRARRITDRLARLERDA
jgi:heme exporter protein D